MGDFGALLIHDRLQVMVEVCAEGLIDDIQVQLDADVSTQLVLVVGTDGSPPVVHNSYLAVYHGASAFEDPNTSTQEDAVKVFGCTLDYGYIGEVGHDD